MKNRVSKKIVAIGFIFLVVIGLNGCASFNQQQTIKMHCANSRLLITNLSQAVSSRKTMLSDGQLCAGEVR